MKQNKLYKALLGLGVAGSLLGVANLAQATGFQLYEQDAAQLGDYHAGAAAEANSASIGWYNPAGLTMIKKQEITTGVTAITLDMPYKGTVQVSTINPAPFSPYHVDINGSSGVNWVPNFHYATPINNRWAFGFDITAPFGLKTNYGNNSALRYAATKTAVQVIDVSPDIAYQVNKVISVGFGLDAQYMHATFDQYAGLAGVTPSQNDTQSLNSGDDWGFGYHAGILFQFTKHTRLGMSYHSPVHHNLRGHSKFIGPLAVFPPGSADSELVSKDLKSSVTLPGYGLVSLFHEINNKWAVMGSVMYTWWNSFENMKLENVAAIDSNYLPSKNVTINIFENYRSTWNFALGVHYKPTQKITLKAGLGYDQSPTRRLQRNVQLPGSDRYAAALGVHYQFLKDMGVDVGYMHLFPDTAKINNVQQVSIETVTTQGSVKGSANLYGVQFTWAF